MARPTKRGLKYFSFDTDFFENDKIKILEAEFGNNGSHIFIRLLNKIYREGYFYQWGKDQCLLLDRATGREYGTELIDKVVEACVDRKLFDKELYDKFGILTSPEIQSRYTVGITKRTDIVIIQEYWLIDDLPSCRVEWIKLVDNSGGGEVSITDKSKNISNNTEKQINDEQNPNNGSEINDRKKYSSTKFLQEETEHIRLDNRKVNNQKGDKDIYSEPWKSSKPSIYKLPTNRFHTEGEEFEVEEDFYNEMQSCYPTLDIMTELKQMRAWLITNQTKRKTKNGMMKFINNWLSNSTNQGKGNPNEQYTKHSLSGNTNSGQPKFYPACSDGRHPGDFAPEEYARAKAAYEAKRDRETAGNVSRLQVQ